MRGRRIDFDGATLLVDQYIKQPFHFSGKRLHIKRCTFEGQRIAVSVGNTNSVTIEDCLFLNLSGHTGVQGEISCAVKIDSKSDCIVSLCNNQVINEIPDNPNRAPGGFIITGNGNKSCLIDGNYFRNIGERECSNWIGAIHLYRNCDRAIVVNNRVERYYFVPFVFQNSGEIICTHNIIEDAVDSKSDAGVAFQYVRNHRQQCNNWILANNIIKPHNRLSYGVTFAGNIEFISSNVMCIGNIFDGVKDDVLLINVDMATAVIRGNITKQAP